MTVTTLALPLYPTFVAVVVLLTGIFHTSKLYYKDWKLAAMDTIYTIIISAAAFFATFGFMIFGGI